MASDEMQPDKVWLGFGFSAFLAFVICGAKLFGLDMNAFLFLFGVGLFGFVFYYKSRKHGIGLGYFELIVFIGLVSAYLLNASGFVVATGFMFLSTPIFFLATEKTKEKIK